MVMLTKIKLYGVAALGVLLTVLAIFSKTMKAQRDRARQDVEHLKATVHAERVKKKIVKEEEVIESSRRATLVNQIKEKKKQEEGKENNFEGIDNLSKPNDF
jgi:5'-3' exonuclease